MLSFSILRMVDSDGCPSNNQNLGHANSLWERLSFCPEYRKLCQAWISTCRITVKSVSMKYFARTVIFVLSLGRYVYCNHPSKQRITKGCEHTSVRAAMLFTVPGREKHRSLLTRIPVRQKHQQYHQFWWRTKPPFVTQESISTISPVDCINRSIHVTEKHFLAQFTFLTQDANNNPNRPLWAILWHQPRTNLQLITKRTRCY